MSTNKELKLNEIFRGSIIAIPLLSRKKRLIMSATSLHIMDYICECFTLNSIDKAIFNLDDLLEECNLKDPRSVKKALLELMFWDIFIIWFINKREFFIVLKNEYNSNSFSNISDITDDLLNSVIEIAPEKRYLVKKSEVI